MAGPVIPAAGLLEDKTFWDAEVYQKWVDLYAGWTAYTPTWSTSNATQPSVGNGTLTGAYRAVGKTVFFRLRFQAGSTTTFGDGLWSFSLPVGYAPTAVQAAPGVAIGPSSARYPIGCYLTSGNGVYRMPVNGSGGIRTNLGATVDVPFEWGSGHQIIIAGVYEAS
ncbi:hypothetical protein [Microbispora sp. KK1-11]|uniref:hypothetical protein n=1 Tax=Microbispora sp. KK1-11 TaxID=2053005 RepID=UPI00115732C6|nr:hypothetical protein [Microbispora sp. KK1-11]TQS29124.1 hypothetical protein FLW16_12320 [Microbispora sp. KK1-11]